MKVLGASKVLKNEKVDLCQWKMREIAVDLDAPVYTFRNCL